MLKKILIIFFCTISSITLSMDLHQAAYQESSDFEVNSVVALLR